MKKSRKLFVVSLAVALVISAGVVFAAGNTKPAKAPVSITAKLKLTQGDATQIALNAHKDAKVINVQLSGKIYIVKLSEANGNRTLKIGGNSGKILKDVGDAVPAAAKSGTTPTQAAKK